MKVLYLLRICAKLASAKDYLDLNVQYKGRERVYAVFVFNAIIQHTFQYWKKELSTSFPFKIGCAMNFIYNL